MTRTAIAAIGLAALMLGGCNTSPPGKEERAAVNYGPRPENHEQIVRDYLRNRLTDPVTALVEFKAGPKQLYQRDTPTRDVQYGWAVCVMINDKNMYGAFNGFRAMVAFIRDGKVAASNGGPEDNFVGSKFAREQCKELGYEVP
jgi:hypothetical protein